jgi:hypothetical protein
MLDCFSKILQIGTVAAASRSAANNKICPSHAFDPNPLQPTINKAPMVLNSKITRNT